MKFLIRNYQKIHLNSPIVINSTTTQFVLIDLSTRLNELASAMLEVLCSLTEDSIIELEMNSNLNKLSKENLVLFVSSEFALTMKEQFGKIFILENDKSKIDNEKRFGNGEDLIYSLADEIYRCYMKESKEYLQNGDLINAKLKEEKANEIHHELKKIYKSISSLQTQISISNPPLTKLIWIKSKIQINHIEIEKIENHFSEVISSFLVFNDPLICHQRILDNEIQTKIFLIIDSNYDESIINDFQKLSNVKIVIRYGQISSENETIIDNYDDLCFHLTHELLTHYNQLGSFYSNKQDAKTAKDMYIKAQLLCQMDF
ncbi:unnamed protein product [Adineta ricciae]|uniref:Uncharacterized protein n=1 Tax=Adineta ricciae TaxID=249248 RepID=A0A815IXB5_ADIRI|nr:unnamed protein product [Adineta ricciae]